MVWLLSQLRVLLVAANGKQTIVVRLVYRAWECSVGGRGNQ